MGFTERRNLKKQQKIRKEGLKKSWDFDVAVNCINSPIFQDCHIQEETTEEGIPTGKYWLIPETKAREIIEKTKQDKLKDRIHVDTTPIVSRNNYQTIHNSNIQSWSR